MGVSEASYATGIEHRPVRTAALMTECAKRFLAALDSVQRSKVAIPFDADERMNWNFVPMQRKGLAMRDMSAAQKLLAGSLLAAGLSQRGYIKAATIMSLEEILKFIEGDSGERRDPEKYYFSVFGTPSEEGAWGYRVEGHHLSQNYTVVNGLVSCGPSFMGANPAEVQQGPRTGLRTLADEDDLGIELIQSLDDERRKIAIVHPSAYAEILTGSNRKAALNGQPSGLLASKMSAREFDALMALMQEYARNVPAELAEKRIAALNEADRDVYFAWAGGTHRRDPHYYRVQARSFLIEFDDTQNNANHIHSVWRDLRDDFGGDLLQNHYHTSHATP